jgi:hypothetical protein
MRRRRRRRRRRSPAAKGTRGCGQWLRHAFYLTAIRTTQGTLDTHTRFVVTKRRDANRRGPIVNVDDGGGRLLQFLAIGYFFMDGRR